MTDTFWNIVKDSEKDRHEVYALQGPKGLLFAPQPKAEPRENPSDELLRLRNEERRERANRLANLLGDHLDKCEAEDVCIASVIDPPIHIQKGDADNPVFVNLLRGEG